MKIVFPCVIIPDIDILILMEAVGGQKIVWFISGECDPFGNEDKSAEIVNGKCENKQKYKFFFQWQCGKSFQLFFSKLPDLDTDGTLLIDLKKNKKIDKKEQNIQPLP
jgi:hypothetical protein